MSCAFLPPLSALLATLALSVGTVPPAGDPWTAEAGLDDGLLLLGGMAEAGRRPVGGNWFRLRRRLRRGAAPVIPGGTGAHAGPAPFPDEAQCRALLDAAPVALWQLDHAGRTIFANARLAALFEGGAPASLAASGCRLAGPADPAGPFGFPPGREVEASLRTAHGRVRRVSIVASPWVPGPGGEAVCLLTLQDITPLRTAQARIEHLAEHDPLTGLANRMQFRGALEALVHGPDGGGLLLLDLDRFKSVNGRHGLAVGDVLLCAVADRLRAAVRPEDMVCRLAGDEFAVLAFAAAAPGMQAMADRLRQALAAPVRVGGIELPVSASIGIACAPEHARDAEGLLRAAELALRQAKQGGGDAILPFRPELRLAAERQERLREALADALREGEFRLAFQPQREMPSRRLMGAEALLRWESRRLGRIVPPSELLPAAMEAGLLPALDAWVLEAGLAQFAAWAGWQGAPPILAVNISGQSLRNPGFAGAVARALLRHRIEARRLEIEIPEDLALRDLPEIAATLEELRTLGVRLALDDFGAGRSSLLHVVRLPVQRLKLDRSIVSGLPGEPKDHAVLHATMALARGMGIEVIGEGVETEDQALALRRAGCTILQGHLTGRPVPAEELAFPPAWA